MVFKRKRRNLAMGDIISSQSLGRSKTVRVNVYESGSVYLYLDPKQPGKLLAPKTLYELADMLVDAAELSEKKLEEAKTKSKPGEKKVRPIIALKRTARERKRTVNNTV